METTTEVQVLSLDEVIQSSLIQNNLTEAVISKLKEDYGGMKLKAVDDKESYLEIKDARKEVRKWGVVTEKICKKGREDAISIQKKWLAKEKEILGKIAEVQDPLDAEIKKFEDEEARKELEAQKKREETWINRQASLSKLGAIYDNGSFVSEHISYELDLLKNSDEEMFAGIILPKYQKVFDEKEAARVAEENKRKAEMEQQRLEREKFDEEQRQFKAQQEEFRRQQQLLREQLEQSNREQRMSQEQKEMEERLAKDEAYRKARAEREARDNARIDELISLGMTYSLQYGAYVYRDVNIDVMTELKLWNDEEWKAAIDKITPVIAQRKKEDEERLLDEIEKEKIAAINQALEAEKIKKEQEEQKKKAELELAGDKEKYADLIKYMQAAPLHSMKSNQYKGKVRVIADFIHDLTA